MEDHMDEKQLKQLLKLRRLNKKALYFELIYALILLFSLVFNFSLFMHLVLIQGVVISLYLIIGWIFDRGDRIIRVKKRDTLWETITSTRFTKLFFLRLFEGIIFFVAIAVALRFSRQLWDILFEMPYKVKLDGGVENIMLYSAFGYVLLMAGIAVGLLVGNKKFIKINSILIVLLAIILLLIHSPLVIPNIIGMSVGVIGIWLSYRVKL